MRALVVFALLTAASMAQPPDSLWSRGYGRGIMSGGTIAPASGGGYVIRGFTGSGINSHALITGINEIGDVTWSRTFYNFGNSAFYPIVVLPDGGYLIGGGNRDSLVMRLDSLGEIVWVQGFGDQRSHIVHRIAVSSSGLTALVGEASAGGENDGWLTLMNEDSVVTHAQYFGATGYDALHDVICTSDSGFLAVGYTSSYGNGNSDFWMIKVSADGDTLWSKTYGGGETDRCNAVVETPDGGYLLAGYTRSFGHPSGLDGWLLRTDSHGDSLWSRAYGGVWSEDFLDILEEPDGGFILTGYNESFRYDNYRDFWMLKVSAQGDSIWSTQFGGQFDEVCRSIIHANDGGYLLAGARDHLVEGGPELWLVKAGTFSNAAPIVAVPDEMSLSVFPNPFNQSTTLRFSLPQATNLSLRIFDVTGRLIAVLAQDMFPSGTHELMLDSNHLSSGVYFAVLASEGRSHASKLLLLK